MHPSIRTPPILLLLYWTPTSLREKLSERVHYAHFQNATAAAQFELRTVENIPTTLPFF